MKTKPRKLEVDPNLTVCDAKYESLKWYGPDTPGFELNGFYFRKPGGELRRLPKRTEKNQIPAKVNELAEFTAGGQLRFRSDTGKIAVHVKVIRAHKIVRMAMNGIMGFDCYTGDFPFQQFQGVTAFAPDAMEYCVDLYQRDRKMRSFTINFPMFAQFESVEFGLEPDAKIEPPTPWMNSQPIVAYGTSILHGACTTRPGLSYPNRLSRLLGHPVLNFGFAGNALGEQSMALQLSKIKSPALYLLDYDANACLEGVQKTLLPLIRTLRKAHPETPILNVSCTPYIWDFPENGHTQHSGTRLKALQEVHRQTLEILLAEKDQNIHLIHGENLIGDDTPWDCLADGVHLNDCGFERMANGIAREIKRILA